MSCHRAGCRRAYPACISCKRGGGIYVSTPLRLYVSAGFLSGRLFLFLFLLLSLSTIMGLHQTRVTVLGAESLPPLIPIYPLRACVYTTCRWHCSASSSSGPHAVRTLLLFCLFSVFFLRRAVALAFGGVGKRFPIYAPRTHRPRPRAQGPTAQSPAAVSCQLSAVSVCLRRFVASDSHSQLRHRPQSLYLCVPVTVSRPLCFSIEMNKIRQGNLKRPTHLSLSLSLLPS